MRSIFIKINGLKTISYFLILFTYLYIIVFTFFHNRKSDGYVLGDWLINYQDGGFKRRGLSGSFFFFLQDLTGFQLNILVFLVQVIIITIFFYFFVKIIVSKSITLWYLSLLLSPLGFIAYFNCVDYVGKKEFILFAIFSYFVYQINCSTLTRKKEYIICILIFIATLFHEIVFFFIPYFVLLLIIYNKNINFKLYIKYFLAGFVPVILILFFGNEINEGNSLQILKERGVVINNGIFFWNVNEREYIVSQAKDYSLYVISFLISFFHIKFYLKIEKLDKKIGWGFLFAFLYTLPLFLLAIDWGRWFYIHMIMIIMVLGFLLKAKKDGDLSKTQFVINKSNIVLLLFIVFSLAYRVEMSGKGFSFEGFFYRVFFVPLELIHKMM